MLARREAKAKERDKKPGGKPPKPPVAGPKAQDKLNLTDEESRIMPVASGGFDQAYNPQAAVDTGTMLVVLLNFIAPGISKLARRRGLTRSLRCSGMSIILQQRNALPCLEFEAHGRIASAVAKTRERRASYDKNQQNSAFQTQSC